MNETSSRKVEAALNESVDLLWRTLLSDQILAGVVIDCSEAVTSAVLSPSASFVDAMA
jgi:hypothetical protein